MAEEFFQSAVKDCHPSDYIRNAPLPHPARCALEIVKEPSTAGILILESVEFKEQPATSHQKYVVNQDR
ncbi:MAG: hypothetical protein WD696_16105 [Bryobacteraceae bacterium]